MVAPEGPEKVAGGEARHERNHRIPFAQSIRPGGAGEAFLESVRPSLTAD